MSEFKTTEEIKYEEMLVRSEKFLVEDYLEMKKMKEEGILERYC